MHSCLPLMLHALPAHSPTVFYITLVLVLMCIYLSCLHRRMLNSTIMHTDVCLRCLIPQIWRWELVVLSVLCSAATNSTIFNHYSSIQMSQHVYEYPYSYIIGPHVMFHMSQLYSMASWSKSLPVRSPVWGYFETVGEKKVHCKLCVPPATTTLCVCACMRCLRACVDAWISVCVCMHQLFGIRLLRKQLFK